MKATTSRKYGVYAMSVKGWEFGYVTPRRLGLFNSFGGAERCFRQQTEYGAQGIFVVRLADGAVRRPANLAEGWLEDCNPLCCQSY